MKLDLQHEWRLFWVAMQFLTRLPTPTFKDYEPNWLHQSSRYLPLVGLVIGLLVGSIFWLTALYFNTWVAAFISTAVGVYITGAFHEDGFADICDGLGGGYTKERSLEIMKDSRLGAFGVLGMLLMVGLKISLLASFSPQQGMLALVIAHALSRLASISLIGLLPYGGDLEHAKAKPMGQHLNLQQWCIAAALVSPVVLLIWWQFNGATLISTLIFAALATAFMYRKLKKRLEGYTGDGLGATQQLAEVAIYLALLQAL